MCRSSDYFDFSSFSQRRPRRKEPKRETGRRRFIMVSEPTDERSAAYAAGYTNISEIGKERIRRAGDLLRAKYECPELDIGFRVYKTYKQQ